jgi:hypothetical protein
VGNPNGPQNNLDYIPPAPAAANIDEYLIPWFDGVEHQAGDFLKTLVAAARRADSDNYRVLRSLLIYFRTKYPEYHQVGLERAKLFPFGKAAAD